MEEYCTSVERIHISALLSAGYGRPVVFLHGNSSSKHVWANQLELICSNGRPVLAPDFPGHGKSGNSSTPASTYSFPGYAAVISGLLDQLRWDCVDLVGWSLGGHVGLELLASEPRIHSLLIVGTPPVRLRPQSLHEAFYADDNMQLAGKPDFSETDTIRYGTALMGGWKHLAPTLLNDIRRTDGNARRWMFSNSLQGIGSDQRHTAENVSKSLCVVHGEKEPFVRLGYLQSLNYRAIWKGKVQVICDAGHAPHWEYPRAFNQILLDFLGYRMHPKKASGIQDLRLQKAAYPSDSG
ncbi:pimeloyl-ACP methyl ester carboxylesterase [Pseudorhodoplanes sinuspersici]|nr:pimeloyl-ACP methyl ester carboxylesterase [Pseudorhodoplanes sinuspersici]